MAKSLYWRIAQVSVMSGFLISAAAHAQLNLQKLGASVFGGDTASVQASSSNVAQLLQTYSGANQRALSGLSTLAMSMGLSEAQGEAKQTAASLAGDSNMTQAALLHANEAGQKVGQELSQAFSQGAAAQALVDKQAFGNGLESLAQGVRQYSQLKTDLVSAGSVNPATLLKAGLEPEKAKAATYMMKNIPEQLRSLSSTLKQAVEFAKNSNIPVPATATSVLGAI